MNDSTMNELQVSALNKIKRHIVHGDGEKYWVRMAAPISEGKNPAFFVSGHVGTSEEMRWFDYNYSFTIGPRGAIKMVDGPDHMKDEWQNKRWCGILIKIR